MKILLILLLTIICSQTSAQTWYWKNPLPSRVPSTKIKFINSNTGISVGYIGDIKRTTNGGSNWYLVSSGTLNNLYDLSFINSNGIAVGDSGTIIKTMDNGISWNAHSNSGTTHRLEGVSFVSDDLIIIAGHSGTILRSTNAGVNWNNIASGTSEHLYEVHFINSSIGYIIGNDGTILYTTNGGQNWIPQFSGTNTVEFTGMHFLNSSTGFVVGGNTGNMWKTTNSGVNWYTTPAGTFSYLRDIQFINSTTGYFIGSNPDNLFSSTDGGNSWSFLAGNFGLNYFSFSANSNFLNIIDNSGNLFHSSNDGLNWTNGLQGFNDSLNGVNFIDMNTGIIVCDDGVTYRTTNAGLNWTQHLSSTNDNLIKVELADQNTGYAIGENSTPLKTTNGGVNWFNVPGPTDICQTLFILNENAVFVGTDEDIWKTSNGGLNWVLLAHEDATDLVFLDQNTGIAISGNIIRSTNGGLNWSEVHTQGYQYLDFNNANTGIAISEGGSSLSITRTTNGGLNWTLIPNSFTSSVIKDIEFMDNNNVIAVGGRIIRSTNAGLTWFRANPSFNTRGVDFVNDSVGFIVGDLGIVLSTIPNPTVGITPVSTEIPEEYSLLQNYPNPFNPTTSIKFKIPNQVRDDNIVSLKIYDIMGREVAVLVNESLSPGEYEVSFNGTGYSSGVYFYRLTAGEYSQSKRMVLLK